MSPKEKASELLSHYNSILIDEISHGGARGYASYKCALITVDEMIDWTHQYVDYMSLTPALIYLENVKKEIEKL